MPFLHQVEANINIKHHLLLTSVGNFSWGEFNKKDVVKLPVGFIFDDSELTKEQVNEINAAMNKTILSEEGQKHVANQLKKFKDTWTSNKPGVAKGVEFEFALTDYRPVVLPPRNLPQQYHEACDKEVIKMLEDDIIEPSTSPYCTYPVLAPKKDGGIRFAVDYRKLNSVTVPDKTPLPKIEDLFAAIKDSSYFGLIDLRWGFWHIPIVKNQRHFTAFRTPSGLWQFKRMPFGLINAPAWFQRWTSAIFSDLRYKGVLVYLDDILRYMQIQKQNS